MLQIFARWFILHKASKKKVWNSLTHKIVVKKYIDFGHKANAMSKINIQKNTMLQSYIHQVKATSQNSLCYQIIRSAILNAHTRKVEVLNLY